MSKRTPHTDALDTLGTIISPNELRDAIHLAVEPVIAGCDLQIGQRIGIANGIAYPAGMTLNGTKIPYHGIVDPFLTQGPKSEECFWFVMAPRMVTSLRHVWAHPDFPDPNEVETKTDATAQLVSPTAVEDQPTKADVDRLVVDDVKAAAYQWITEYAQRLEQEGGYDDDEYYSIDADELIQYGIDYISDSEAGRWPDYLVKGGVLEGVYTDDEFWNQLEKYTGALIPANLRGNFFSCSC